MLSTFLFLWRFFKLDDCRTETKIFNKKGTVKPSSWGYTEQWAPLSSQQFLLRKARPNRKLM